MPATIVLVHGAFADSSGWDTVIDPLLDAGHPVIAAANPLHGLATDAAAVADVVRAVDGPVVLAAHSYGGAVISNVPADAGDIIGLVYANGFAPDAGESCFQLAGMFPGSMLGEATLRPVPRSDGTTDLYIRPTASTTCSARMCRASRPPGWPSRSGRRLRRRSSRPRVRRSGATCRRGS